MKNELNKHKKIITTAVNNLTIHTNPPIKENGTTIINYNPSFTITSQRIAEITEKRHDNVLRDIESEIKELNKENSSLLFKLSSYKDKNNVERKNYLLSEAGVLQLAARYSAATRFKLVIKTLEYNYLKYNKINKFLNKNY